MAGVLVPLLLSCIALTATCAAQDVPSIDLEDIEDFGNIKEAPSEIPVSADVARSLFGAKRTVCGKPEFGRIDNPSICRLEILVEESIIPGITTRKLRACSGWLAKKNVIVTNGHCLKGGVLKSINVYCGSHGCSSESEREAYGTLARIAPKYAPPDSHSSNRFLHCVEQLTLPAPAGCTACL